MSYALDYNWLAIIFIFTTSFHHVWIVVIFYVINFFLLANNMLTCSPGIFMKHTLRRPTTLAGEQLFLYINNIHNIYIYPIIKKDNGKKCINSFIFYFKSILKYQIIKKVVFASCNIVIIDFFYATYKL